MSAIASYVLPARLCFSFFNDPHALLLLLRRANTFFQIDHYSLQILSGREFLGGVFPSSRCSSSGSLKSHPPPAPLIRGGKQHLQHSSAQRRSFGTCCISEEKSSPLCPPSIYILLTFFAQSFFAPDPGGDFLFLLKFQNMLLSSSFTLTWIFCDVAESSSSNSNSNS